MNDVTCAQPACNLDAISRGVCSRHYQILRKQGALPPKALRPDFHQLTAVDKSAKTGICSICGPVSVRVRSGGRSSQCGTLRSREVAARTAEQRRAVALKTKFGISLEDFGLMLAKQNGVCAICGHAEPGRNLAVDHDHQTGEVRGLLCMLCNTAIGHFRDSHEHMAKAIAYLTRN